MTKEYWDKVWSLERPYLGKNNQPVSVLPWDLPTHDSHIDYILSITKPKTILELGCGYGTDSIYMVQQQISVTAIDIADKAITAAKEKKDANLVNFLCKDFFTYNSDNSFDLVYDRGFIHTQQKIVLESIFKKVYNFCSHDGYYVIICGNYNDDNIDNAGNRPSVMSLSSIEKASAQFFKIRLVQEIVIELNENFLNGIGWLVVLQKRVAVNPKIYSKM